MANGPSSYLRYLPELFRAAGPGGEPPFLGEFLKIFEALLSGRADARDRFGVQGIEETIERFPETLDPALTPVDNPNAPEGAPLRSAFLDYLASWVALALDQNWDLGKRREWTRRIVPLYRRRGTRDGLQDYLNTFVGDEVTIDEPDGGITLGIDNTTVGVDTFIADAPAYFFRVRIRHGFPPNPFDFDVWNNLISGTRAILDLEKPAHTYYMLDARAPGIIVAERSTVGQDTLIWANSTP
ncbi:MAG TPA: phage tail protein [Longimicrobiales bacterium]